MLQLEELLYNIAEGFTKVLLAGGRRVGVATQDYQGK